MSEWRAAPRADFAVLGDPIGHSWSPLLHKAAYNALGLDLHYEAIRVPLGELRPALDHLARLGYRGVNCTVPLKIEAFEWAEDNSPVALRAGAANTLDLSGRSATNTDVGGFQDAIALAGLAAPGVAVVIGAGGAARAVIIALHELGFDTRVYNRTVESARAMLRQADVSATLLTALDVMGAELVIDATAADLSGEPIQVAWDRTSNHCVAMSLLYSSEPVPFLRRAEASGRRTLDGRTMLVSQAARSLEWWLGVEAPRQAMLEALP